MTELTIKDDACTGACLQLARRGFEQGASPKYRLRRLDPRNFVIEKYVPPTKADRKIENWSILGYYGNLSDLTVGLTRYLIEIPEGDNLLEQVVLLRREVEKLERSISQQLTPHHTIKAGITGQTREAQEGDV
jgi:hypothetical protein